VTPPLRRPRLAPHDAIVIAQVNAAVTSRDFPGNTPT
jgi:hypothetical protein